MNEEPVERRYLIRRPRALQYFHNGRFKKTSEKERVAGRFELFFDLLYVALIANFADYLTEEPSGIRLVVFILTFTPAWHAWADAKENANNYYNDDLVQRVGILWIMALLVVYGNNANGVAEDLGALRATVGSYILVRLTQISFYTYYSISSHFHRQQNWAYAIMITMSFGIWVPLFLDEEHVSNPVKIAVAVLAIVYEEVVYVLTFGPWFAKWMKLEYTTAVDIEHENDRYTAFTIIVLGEFTYAILVTSPAHGGLNLGLLRAVWTLVIAFCFNSMYVYSDGSLQTTHPIRRSVPTAFAWLLLHLPLSMGLLLGGHVSAAAVGEEHMGTGRRWLWGGGLGIGFFGMWILAQLYKSDDPPSKLMMPKQLRILPRLAAAVILVLLPLSEEERVDSTSLISIGAAISAFVVIWETVGALEKDACLFESWRGELSDDAVDFGHIVSNRHAGYRRHEDEESENAQN